MTKQLTTQNATITTAAVELQTLTISGKQVTLAVFRQLREELLVADDGTLNGVPWGIVNYHPEKCTDSQFPHWHVVWQHGTELRRARINHVAHFDEGGRDRHGEVRYQPRLFTSEIADRVLTGSVLAWLTGRQENCPLPETGQNWIGAKHFENVSYYDSGHGFRVMAHASSAALAAANARASLIRAQADAAKAQEQLNENKAGQAESWETDHGEGYLRRTRAAEEESRTSDASAHDTLAREVTGWGVTREQVLEDHRAEVQAEADWRQAHRNTLTALSELPQLFIAV